MPTAENNAAFQRNPAVLEAVIGDDHVLFHPENGKYCHLNDIGNEVWSILATTHTLVELTEALSRKYEVDEATCQADTRTFLNKLQESAFISLAEPSLTKAAY